MLFRSALSSLLSPELGDRLRPWLLAALTALLVCRPLFPSETVATEGDGLPVVMLWLGLACVWLLSVIVLPEVPIRFWLVDGAVLLLMAAYTGAGIWAVLYAARRPAMNMLWEWIGMGVAFLLVRQLAAGRRECRALMAVMIALAVGLSCYGLYQYVYELPQTRAYYATDPDGALREAGVWYEPGSPPRYLFEQRLASPEPLTTFALTNSLAGFLAPWFTVLAVLGIAAWAERRARWLWLGALAGCTLVGLCLWLTRSRSAYVAVAMGLILTAIGYRHALQNRVRRAVLIVAGLAGLAVVVMGLVNRSWLDEAQKSLGYRLQYWQSTLQMIQEKPLTGCGPGNFQNAYTAYKLPEASEEVADPHNFLLEIWATGGTGAGLAAVAVLAAALYLLWPRSRSALRESGLRQAILSDPGGWHGASDGPQLFADAEADRPIFVVAGAVVGFPLAWIIGGLGSSPPNSILFWLVMPPSLVCLGLLWKWIRSGRVSPSIPALGAVVLAIHLLASGGIGFPGVALSLWLLLALALNISETDRVRVLPRMATYATLGLVLVLLAVCYVTGYSPVLGARGYLRMARVEPDRAEEWLQEAATADPYARLPLEHLAEMELAAWRSGGDAKHLSQFEEYDKWTLLVEPNSAAAWFASGNDYFEIYTKTRLKRNLDRALRAYRAAVMYYPNSALYRARLALAHQAAGNLASFEDEAAKALELDEATPHVDKKLPEELRERLRQGGGPGGRAAGRSELPGGGAAGRGELPLEGQQPAPVGR